MSKNLKKFSFYFLITALAITGVIAWRMAVNRKLPKDSYTWSVILKHLGTLSSPRLADLNEDGFLDIVVGAGNVEFKSNDSAVVALDGANGKILWTAHARDQIFGSAVFKDITGDGIPDVFVGGRAAELKAING